MLFLWKPNQNTGLGLNMGFLNKAESGTLDTKYSLLPPQSAAECTPAFRIPGDSTKFPVICCNKNAMVQKSLMTQHFMEDYLLKILHGPAQRPQHNSRGKELTQTGQSFWLDFHSRFFSPLFFPLFAKKWKCKVFSYRGCLGHWVTQYLSKHIIHKTWVGFFPPLRKFNFSKILSNQLVHIYRWAQALKRPFHPFL